MYGGVHFEGMYVHMCVNSNFELSSYKYRIFLLDLVIYSQPQSKNIKRKDKDKH